MTATPEAPAELPVQLGRALAACRGDRTLAELADVAGIDYRNLIAIEAGTKNPTLDRVARLADVYGARLAIVDLDALEAELDLILRGKLGTAAVPRRNAIARLVNYITQENPNP